LAVALSTALLTFLRARGIEREKRRLLEHLPQTAVAVIDHDLRVRFATGPALGLAADTAGRIKGRSVSELLPPSQAEAFATHCRATLRGERRSFQLHSQHTRRDYWVRLVPLPDRGGDVDAAMAVSLDISDRWQIDRDLGSGPGDVDAIADVTRSLARSVDPDAARNAICEGARRIADAPVAVLFEPGRGGLLAKASAGAELRDMELPLDPDSGAARAFARADEAFVAGGAGESRVDRAFLGRTRTNAVLWHPVIRDRAAIGVLAIGWREGVAGVSLRLSALIDVLAAEAAVAIGRADMLGRLEHMARTDDLTGLPNRRYWEQQLPRELSRAWREQQAVCVAMFDLDHFKAYNDRRGHQAGDRLLREAAAAWRSALRSYDVLARYGGEEFALILPGCDLDDGLALVERLRVATPDGESCSAGIAEWDGEEQPETLLGRADAALYQAKRAGRDQVVTAPAR
jgi:diguanylate cyclase (GGDEF)-like protein